MKDNRKCIMVVDEHKFLEILTDLLCIKEFIVLPVDSGETALDIFNREKDTIDLILLDVMMPGISGMEFLQCIRENSDVPIIILTAKSQVYDQYQGFKAGADDYITKPFSFAILLQRIDAILRRRMVNMNKSDEFICGLIRLLADKRKVFVKDEEIVLKRREYELLYYLMKNKNITLSREQLLNNVWGYDFDGDIRTVDTHIKQLRQKLGGAATQIKTEFGVGYRMEEKNA